jgi:hypothetical protein
METGFGSAPSLGLDSYSSSQRSLPWGQRRGEIVLLYERDAGRKRCRRSETAGV